MADELYSCDAVHVERIKVATEIVKLFHGHSLEDDEDKLYTDAVSYLSFMLEDDREKIPPIPDPAVRNAKATGWELAANEVLDAARYVERMLPKQPVVQDDRTDTPTEHNQKYRTSLPRRVMQEQVEEVTLGQDTDQVFGEPRMKPVLDAIQEVEQMVNKQQATVCVHCHLPFTKDDKGNEIRCWIGPLPNIYICDECYKAPGKRSPQNHRVVEKL